MALNEFLDFVLRNAAFLNGFHLLILSPVDLAFRSHMEGVDGRVQLGREIMSEVDELRVHIEALETHVARLEGIFYVLLEQLEAGTIEESAASIRAQLPRIELD